MRCALLLIALVLGSITVAGCGQIDMPTSGAAATSLPSTATPEATLSGLP